MLPSSVGILLAWTAGAAGALALERLPNNTLQLPPFSPVYGFTRTNDLWQLTFTNPWLSPRPG
jgi:hypothetical protein